MSNNKTVIHWFRKGLRIHDNPALTKACAIVSANPEKYVLRPIFILDTELTKWMNVGSNRFRFLQQSLLELHQKLQTINSRLYVIRGNPKDVFPRLFQEWQVSLIAFESDIEPYAKKRDAFIENLANHAGIEIIQEISHTIYDPYEIIRKNGGKPVMQYKKFLSIADKLPIVDPLPDPPNLPSSGTVFLKDSLEQKNPNCYDPPQLDEMVSDKTLGLNLYPGGELQGLNRMNRYIKQTDWITKFEKPNTSPNSIEPSTTVLSPYIKFGCLSSRLFFKELRKVLSVHPKHTKPPVSLVGQLMWREFYYSAAAAEPNFDRMVGNALCYQIPWSKNDEHLEAWSQAKTGYPFIDAIMRQLRQEGWIHHLARHAVACFLTRGDLWISWEEGQKVFEELLLDADWALNAGNWMWLSASAFFYQYFRVYSPVAFGKKTDPVGNYIRKYVPELKKYPAGVIYEPWKVSSDEQKKYGCIIGKDYPQRIVVHEIVSKENMAKMAAAYKKQAKNSSNVEKVGNTSKKRESSNVKSNSTIRKYFKKS